MPALELASVLIHHLCLLNLRSMPVMPWKQLKATINESVDNGDNTGC